MPFQKGRAKTGGRTKESKHKKSRQLIDQLRGYGFNFARELADGLKKLPPEIRFEEMKRLLPYLTPKLREKEVDISEERDNGVNALSQISNEDLLKAVSGESRETQATSPAPLVTRPPELQVSDSTSSSDDLRDLATEQREE